MEHEAPAILLALEQSAFGAAIRQSPWLYPAANIGHIAALVCFAGAVTVMDLRLIGAFSAYSPDDFIRRARTVAIAAFCGLVVTGFLLFSAEASHVALNPVFQVKVAVIAAALINVAVYEFVTRNSVANIPAGHAMPPAAQAAGYLSLAAWLLVAICGRSIAYF